MIIKNDKLNELLIHAGKVGATRASTVAVADIVVDNNLANKCTEPRCPNYGLSQSCPPHVAGPAAFREKLEDFEQAIFFRLGVPFEILLSSDRPSAFQLLNQVATEIERTAVKEGFTNALAYTAGACKALFCNEYDYCQALTTGGKCRNPQYARHSMSGYGVDVGALAETAGWPMNWGGEEPEARGEKMSGIYGMVLIY